MYSDLQMSSRLVYQRFYFFNCLMGIRVFVVVIFYPSYIQYFKLKKKAYD